MILSKLINLCTPPSPEIIKKLWVFNGNRVFSHNFSRKRLHVRLLSGFWIQQWISPQILAIWLLKITGKHWHKGCIGMKRIMPCLHIHVFILFSFLCLTFQARRQLFSYTTLNFIMHFMIKCNVVYLCLCGKYSTQSLFYWKRSLSN